jgi:hypothetical protein
MGVNDVIAMPEDQLSDSQAGRQIRLTAHGDGKHLNTRFKRFFFHRRSGLADQMAVDSPFNERSEKI